MPTLRPTLLERLRAALSARSGLEPPTWVLEARLADRIAALGLAGADAYLELVTSGGGSRELELLVELLRVGETAFFRHRAHGQALVEAVIPALRTRKPGGTLRAWSAGCASGEEAYTLALLLSRHLPGQRLRVLGTDISKEALAVARARTYADAALTPVPAVLRSSGFEPAGHGRWRVADHVARLVTFEQRNLADGAYPRGFDLIWCRNVLIYFSPEARAQAVRRLVDSLDDGGFLFVGYAESLRDVPNLERVRTPDAVLYRKRPGITRARSASSPGGALPDARATGRESSSELVAAAGATAAGAGADAVTVALRGRYEDAGRLAREVATALGRAGARVVVDLDGAEYLGEEAAAVLRRAGSAARAAGLAFDLLAERPGPRRWLERYRLSGEDGE